MAQKRYMRAINEALHEEMERDPRVILFGEDVEVSILGETMGLRAKFGDRVRDTPICEATIMGMAVGAAAAGRRVIVHLMFGNFVYTAFDAIANQIAKLPLMTGGQIKLPITVLAFYGGGACQAAQHSDSPHPMLMNLSGINVVVPATPADAKGLVKAAIRGDTPTFVLEPLAVVGSSGEVPEGDCTVPIGQAQLLQEGSDLTLITIGSTLRATQQAAQVLSREGLSVEVLDLRSLAPLDEAAILKSVEKTGHVIVVDEARERCSAASEIAAILAERAFDFLKAPVRRVTTPNVSMPYAPNAERALLPSAERIISAAHLFSKTHEKQSA